MNRDLIIKITAAFKLQFRYGELILDFSVEFVWEHSRDIMRSRPSYPLYGAVERASVLFQLHRPLI